MRQGPRDADWQRLALATSGRPTSLRELIETRVKPQMLRRWARPGGYLEHHLCAAHTFDPLGFKRRHPRWSPYVCTCPPGGPPRRCYRLWITPGGLVFKLRVLSIPLGEETEHRYGRHTLPAERDIIIDRAQVEILRRFAPGLYAWVVWRRRLRRFKALARW